MSQPEEKVVFEDDEVMITLKGRHLTYVVKKTYAIGKLYPVGDTLMFEARGDMHLINYYGNACVQVIQDEVKSSDGG